MLLSLRKKENDEPDKSCIPESFSDEVIADTDFTMKQLLQCNVT